ncbi:MAG: threonine--tRNA ligase [Bacillota bacterium]
MNRMDMKRIRKELGFLLSCAVAELYPSCLPCSGDDSDEGFYYDFYFKEGEKLSSSDIPQISLKLKQLLNSEITPKYELLPYHEAERLFMNNKFKMELVNQKSKNKDEIPCISFGNNYDAYYVCDIHSKAELKNISWELDRVSGAYWMSDENNPMLVRISALAFESQEALAEYYQIRKEALECDHRKLGQELELFTSSSLVGKGLPMLLPKGAMLRMILERFIVDEELKRGYQSVYTPPIASLRLYEASGHWHYYKDSMYPPFEMRNESFMLRPTSCPHHIMLYSDKPRSYRELPMRIGELASLFRREQSGELSGLIRIMNFTLADAHIFCTSQQVKSEFIGAVELVKHVMQCLGISDKISYKASLRDKYSEKFFDNPEMWEQSEALLLEILDEMGIEYSIGYGDAAFYGPKLDVQMKNVYGKEETVFTVQVDSYLPERFNLNYINHNGEKQAPVIIHRSSVGCIERTMAFLIEHYRGAFPSWLAPVQARLLTINEKHIPYAQSIEKLLMENSIRIEKDYSEEKLGKKIRNGRLMKIPYLIIMGDNEMEQNKITIRSRDSGNQCTIDILEFIDNLKKEISSFSINLDADKCSRFDSWSMLHL